MQESPFEHIPPELREFFFSFDWDPEKVWAVDVSVESIPRTELDWHLDLPFWSSSDEKPLFDIVPNDVFSNKSKFPEHFERIQSADLAYPIDVMWNRDRFVILDGMHRLARLTRTFHQKSAASRDSTVFQGLSAPIRPCCVSTHRRPARTVKTLKNRTLPPLATNSGEMSGLKLEGVITVAVRKIPRDAIPAITR
jgi:hypothetical protein